MTAGQKLEAIVPAIPVYRREGATIRNYTHMYERQFTEQSSYHLGQRLGQTVGRGSALKMPPMKPGFQSKESINRRTQAILQMQASSGHPSPLGPRERGRFFGGQSGMPKTGSHSISNGNGSSKGNLDPLDGRKTNTLSYSETLGPNTISGYGRKTDISEANTVFGITLKGNQTAQLDCAELRESAHFGGSAFQNNPMNNSGPDNFEFEQGKNNENQYIGGSQNSTVKSELVDPMQIEEAFSNKIHKIAELRCNWFQFYTDIIYCAVSSLILVINNIEYNVPFGLAKSLLASRQNLEMFLNGTIFTNQGEVNVDASFLEIIKGSRLDNENFVTDEEVQAGEITAKLIFPSADIWLRSERKWITKNLDAKELRSIDQALTFMELNLHFDWRSQSNLRTDPLRELDSPHQREEIPSQVAVRSEIERLEKIRQSDSAASRRKNSDGSTVDEPFERTGSAWKLNATNKEGVDQKIQLCSLIYEDSENKKHKINISFEDYLKATESLPLGSDEEEEIIALHQITKRLAIEGSIFRIPEEFDIIPGISGYVVIESTTEIYNIIMPCLKLNLQEKGRIKKQELTLKDFRYLLEGDVKSNCKAFAAKL